MSAIQSVAQAIIDSDVPMKSGAIIAMTGENAAAVYNALSMLRNAGGCRRDAKGRQVAEDQAVLSAAAAGERIESANGKVHHAAAPTGDDGTTSDDGPRGVESPQRGKKRKYTKRQRARKVAKPRKKRKARKQISRNATPPQDAPRLVFSLSEDGNVRVDRADGEGTCTFIPRADALRLLGCLEAWRIVLEAE